MCTMGTSGCEVPFKFEILDQLCECMAMPFCFTARNDDLNLELVRMMATKEEWGIQTFNLYSLYFISLYYMIEFLCCDLLYML